MSEFKKFVGNTHIFKLKSGRYVEMVSLSRSEGRRALQIAKTAMSNEAIYSTLILRDIQIALSMVRATDIGETESDLRALPHIVSVNSVETLWSLFSEAEYEEISTYYDEISSYIVATNDKELKQDLNDLEKKQ